MTVTVRETEHGPLVCDASDELTTVGQVAPNGVVAPPRGDGYAVALRWTALTPGRTMDAVSRLNTAQTWEEFRDAAELFEVPAQNLIFASVDGTIGYQTPGRIPIRTGYDGKYPALGWDPKQTWSGYIPFDALPWVRDPEDGWVVTANQASVYEDYPYFLTDDWSYGARSQRIVDLVTLATTEGRTMTADRMREIQFDSWNENAAFLVPKVQDAAVTGAAVGAITLFDGWDFRQPSDSAPPRTSTPSGGTCSSTPSATSCRRTTCPTVATAGSPSCATCGTSRTTRGGTTRRTPATETRDDAVVRALDEAADELTGLQGNDPTGWSWGELHTLLIENQTLGKSGIKPIEALFNRGPVTTSGGDSIVNATGWSVPDGYAVDWVPSMRMMLDLGDLDRSTWVNLTGNSGHTYNRNYVDQLDAWQEGTTFPFPFTVAAVDAATTDRLLLKPG